MAGTFSKLYIHLVFAVKGRQSLIMDEWKDELYKYIAGIIKSKNQKPIIINGMPDHIHLFVGLTPSYMISTLVNQIKSNSSGFINSNKLLSSKFYWQEGGFYEAVFYLIYFGLIHFDYLKLVNLIRALCRPFGAHFAFLGFYNYFAPLGLESKMSNSPIVC